MGKSHKQQIEAPKPIEAPEPKEAQGNDLTVANVIEVRSSTPQIEADQEDESPGIPDATEPGLTPAYEKSDSENSDEEESDGESQGDSDEKDESGDEEEKGLEAPSPVPTNSSAPWLNYIKSGPITPDDVPKSPKVKIVEKPKESITNENPKALKRKIKDPKAKSKELKKPQEESEDSQKERRRLNPEELFMLQQKMMDHIKERESLQEMDNRTLMLSMHSQIAALTGAVGHISSSFDKVHSKLTTVYGHSIETEEIAKRGFDKLETLVTTAWGSQGRNRASIDENRGLLKEIIKSIDSIKTYQEAPGIKNNSNPGTSWVFPGPGSPGFPFSGPDGLPYQVAPGQPTSSGSQRVSPMRMPGAAAQGHGYQKENPQDAHREQAACRFCAGPHPPPRCTTFPTWQSRRRLMLDQKACFYCLEQGVCADGKMHDKCTGLAPCKQCQIDYPFDTDLPRRHHHHSLCERAKQFHGPKEVPQPPNKKPRPYVKKENSKPKYPKHTQ
ncbi:hypothetical protein CAEBREN_25712 [Caenorhabditis brenneri]|uniref:Uncharacterized protein n=1 Tax=Caenorhabditis brenneri TaxID=135651 RepID=G0N823_CAEBE|nr:hypothetical protein CAEBREN_25712 [Caenorhabditis brenneri]